MVKKIMKIGAWFLLLGYLVVSLAFVNDKRDETSIKTIVARVLDSSECSFVSNTDVLDIINKVLPDWKNKSVAKINKNDLEQAISSNAYIKSAEVYGLLSGNLVVEVTQRKPIARILSKKGYYIDKLGAKIPLSRKATARVLIISGHVGDSLSKEIVAFVNYIGNDKFLQSQITQVDVARNGEFILIPRVGDHKIEFGTVKNYKEKFRNLLALYHKGFSQTGWNKYSKINLKFSNQVVCTKKK